MKNFKQPRVVKLSILFLAVPLLVLFSPLDGKAQSNIDSLKDTEWAWIAPYQVNNIILQRFYRFEDGGKVIRVLIAHTEGRTELGIDYNLFAAPHLFNPNYGGLKTDYIPSVVNKREATRKYTIKGTTLIVEFSDTVEHFTYCDKKDKDLLCPEKATERPIYKISPVSKQDNSTTSTTNSADKDADSILTIPPWTRLHSQAKTLEMNKQYDEAVKKYTQALDITPPLFKMMIYRERGMCKFELQDYKGAIADYNQAIKLYFDSDDSEILKVRGGQNNKYILAPLYFLRGNAQKKLGEETSAYGDFREACKLDGSFVEACAKLKTKE